MATHEDEGEQGERRERAAAAAWAAYEPAYRAWCRLRRRGQDTAADERALRATLAAVVGDACRGAGLDPDAPVTYLGFEETTATAVRDMVMTIEAERYHAPREEGR